VSGLLLAYFQVGKLRPYSHVPFPSLFNRYFEFVWLVCSYFGSEHLKLLYGYVVWTGVWICCRNSGKTCESRLGEMNRDSSKLYYASGRLGDPLMNFERTSISPRREGSRLSEIPRGFPDAFSSPRLGEGGLT